VAKPNLTFPSGLVLHAISQGYRYGFDIMDATGLPSGTIYPALRRLEAAGCLRSDWESAEEADAERRPPRCYYGLTPAGEALLEQAIRRFPAIRLSVGPGSTLGGSTESSPEPSPEPGRA
jgi:DNA-binding PadR family transcriptional regulator